MNKEHGHRLMVRLLGIISATIFLSVWGVASVSAHGPKGHKGNTFTALAAVKKSLELYDKLVASGKLEESWETTLSDITVHEQTQNGQIEYKVQFERSNGNPRSVYIFLDKDGNYSGSNFTGE
jgi:hypothetical protein